MREELQVVDGVSGGTARMQPNNGDELHTRGLHSSWAMSTPL